MIYWPAKPAGAIEDFQFDFSGALEADETLTSKTVVAMAAVKNSDAFAGGNKAVTVWLQGGVNGTPAIVTCSVETSKGRTYAETAVLPIGEEPVSLEMARKQCRSEGITSDDDYLLELIQSAREHVEAYCGIRLAPVALTMSFASFSAVDRLTQAPIQSIVEIRYLDTVGAEQLLDPSIYERIDVESDPLRPAIRAAFGKTFPSARQVDDAIRVSAIAGYAVVPKPVIRAMLLLISQWYDNRQPIAVGTTVLSLPNAVEALLANFRR